MRDTDPTTTPVHETETTQETDHAAAFAALSEQIDDIIAGDTEGKLSSANKPPYPEGYPDSHEVVERAVGDRYGRRLARTQEDVYGASYVTKVEPPQPHDDGEAGYNPYDFVDTRYQWHHDDAGKLDYVSKNGEPLNPEAQADAVEDIKRVISEGLESGDLTADAIPEGWHANRDYYSPSAAAKKAELPATPETAPAPVQAARPKTAMGRLAAMLGLGKNNKN